MSDINSFREASFPGNTLQRSLSVVAWPCALEQNTMVRVEEEATYLMEDKKQTKERGRRPGVTFKGTLSRHDSSRRLYILKFPELPKIVSLTRTNGWHSTRDPESTVAII